MNNKDLASNKCVIVIDQSLPVGVIANTAAVLSINIGKIIPEIVGHDHKDNAGDNHHGITTMAIPILKSNGLALKEMRQAMKVYEPDLIVIDLITATQSTKSYADYVHQYENTPIEYLEYLGLALYGEIKVVNKFTGSLGLLR
ncbi:MAG TPA: DUF2000 domain-containing protein [Gammaproteobacteria bacterium]|nr:DUF2000 domain-containing protein [Gammaproteobacteria bacterium]